MSGILGADVLTIDWRQDRPTDKRRDDGDCAQGVRS
jgi:hypothetical protein